jgi:hypothetical protein
MSRATSAVDIDADRGRPVSEHAAPRFLAETMVACSSTLVTGNALSKALRARLCWALPVKHFTRKRRSLCRGVEPDDFETVRQGRAEEGWRGQRDLHPGPTRAAGVEEQTADPLCRVDGWASQQRHLGLGVARKSLATLVIGPDAQSVAEDRDRVKLMSHQLVQIRGALGTASLISPG